MITWTKAVVFPCMAVLVSTAALTAQAVRPATHDERERTTRKLDKEERPGILRRAMVWATSNVGAKDLRAGPKSPSIPLPPNTLVTCDYVDEKMSGASPKFKCRLDNGEVLKVRFGGANGEVMGSVLGSRLLWALGFGADRVYPVRVRCRGCAENPWTDRARVEGEHVFDPATIEFDPEGDELKFEGDDAGWAWPELAPVAPSQGPAAVVHREALALLAVLIQHTDSKAQQQRLLCLPGGFKRGACDRPFLYVHDLGLTFGQATVTNAAPTASVNFEAWSKTPVWHDARACVGNLSKSLTGTLEHPRISEGGRAFLSGLLARLTDRQLHDLFDVARVERRSRNPSDPNTTLPASVEQWVEAFKAKRAEIARARCQ